jgi:hypothetical protein
VTSIAGHGLGSLATASSVTSATIDDSTIVDADISGTAAISSTKISFAADSVSGNAIDGGTISNFASTGIDDNATATAIAINASGNVGIGTASPASLLQINNGSVTAATITTAAGALVSGDAAGAAASVGYRTSLLNSTANTSGYLRSVRTAGTSFIGTELGTETNHGIRFLTNGTTDTSERMRISNTGNVGIGSTSPQGLLDVNGKLTVLSGGNVGIGSASPGARLDVNGTIKTAATSNAGTTIDFSTGNLQYTSASCGAMTLNNMVSGATYTLAVQGAAGGTCSFTAYTGVGTGALTVKSGTVSLIQTASKHALFTFLVIGSNVYVASIDAY